MNLGFHEFTRRKDFIMLKKMNDCVDCGAPCTGGFCRLINSYSICCDRCGDRPELFYLLDDETLCRDCFVTAALENAETRTPQQLVWS